MSHLSMDALLNLREPGLEPGAATAREHLNQCPQCQAELDRLHQRVARLKALPPLRPSRDRWPETSARLTSERRQRRTRMAALSGLATAASLAAVIGLGRMTRPADSQVAATEQLYQAMERSHDLESALSEYNPEGRVLDGRTARMAEELEDRIARVDRELEATELLPQDPPEDQLLKLWRERVGLLDALVDVHVTRASNAGL
jgi:hypothetical protein